MKRNRTLFITTFIVSIIYILWRAFFTLPFDEGIFDIICSILLLAAELFGFLELVNQYKGMANIMVPERPDIPDEIYPDIDVFIATYDESEELLEKTVNGCINMDYPDKSKVHIYICDDTRRDNIKKLAKKMGVGYFRREDNKDAKAGNYNNALAHSNSPLVATFDADMIPMHNFLIEMVPYFFIPEFEKKDGKWVRREKVDENFKIGFVQSPQSFYNADLFQYALYSEYNVPNEQDFFFKELQLRRNKSNSVIYCGSNTIISRQALNHVGGIYTGVITEDLATGYNIQSKGYTCYAIPTVVANGLSPTDIKSLYKQRDRWGRGCIQSFRKMGLIRKKGLSRAQRWDYFMSLIYWYMPLRRMIFILSPMLFVIFNVTILECKLWEILLFWLPQILLYNASLKYLLGNIRTSRLSNIYDTIMAPKLALSMILETVGIKKRKFSVTKKERDTLDVKDCLYLAMPHIILMIMSVISIGICMYNALRYENIGYFIILFWLLLNSYNLLMSIFFLFGRKVVRNSERMNIKIPAKVKFDGKEIDAMTDNISEGGIMLEFNLPIYINSDSNIEIEMEHEDGRYKCILNVKIVHVIRSDSKWKYAFKFKNLDREERLKLYSIIYDRKPTLPIEINNHSSFYEDLSNNIFMRMKKKKKSSRLYPRMKIYEDISVEKLGKIKIINFNYEFILIESLKVVPPDLTLKIKENQIKVECTLEKLLKGNKYLYKVRNVKELANNMELVKFLNESTKKYERVESERKEYLKSLEKMTSDDEYDDMNYI